MGDKSALQKAASYTGFLASILSLVLGIVHVCNVKARIHWPSGKIIDDVQLMTWRAPLFTFTPDIFFDLWTPCVFGLVGVGAHVSNFNLIRRIGTDYIHYFCYLMIQALFANIGYDGGFGIIVSAFSLLGALLALVAAFEDRQACANLDLSLGVKFERPPKN